jgi:hypothetical protein
MRRAAQLTLLLACALSCSGKSKGKAAADAALTSAAVTDAGGEAGLLDAGPKEAPKALTQEEVLAMATADVQAAAAEAKEKKPDCDKIVDKLDVSFDIVMPKMEADDRAVFSVYATCAKKRERWRLLQQVASAMIDGEPAYKQSWQMTRALAGLGQYDAAARLGASILRLWPKEAEVYTSAALASSRIEDWENVGKQADQGTAIARKGGSDEISALAHMWRGLAFLHKGKVDEGIHELDVAKKLSSSDEIARLRDRADVVKNTGIILDADLPDHVYLGVAHLYPKNVTPLGPTATLRLYNIGDKPLQVHAEVTLSGVADPLGKSVTLYKGVRQVLKLTPTLKADLKIDSVKDTQAADVGYKITNVADGSVLYEETRKTTVEPRDRLPTFLRVHDGDNKPVRELAAAWVTPTAKAVALVLDAAKKRVPGAQFTGTEGPTFPQVLAVWDELRARGVSFVRDPGVDSEGTHMQIARLPADVLAAGSGNALEGSLVFAALLEAIGLDVILVNVPGHAFIGWFPSSADRGTGAMKSAVTSPMGKVFFLETTMVKAGPADAAVLRGDAEYVERASARSFADGRASALQLSKIRKAGVLPQPSE